jgi:WS/DGAT/MGAT family acyltransferase
VQQLTAVDTGFLTMETGTQFGHVGSLSIFEPAATYDAICRQIEQRLHLLPPYRRQLVEVPFGLDHPYWIESPNFDLDFHLRHIAVPAPGNREQLSDLVARLAARPLDRSRPLWEYYVIDGLESGDVAHYAKTHHATIDGASGVEMAAVLLDDRADKAPPPPPDQPWRPEAVPTNYDLLSRTMARLATGPQRMAQAQWRLFQAMSERARANTSSGDQPWTAWMNGWQQRRPPEAADEPPPLPTTPAPRTPFNAPITAHRRWAYTTLALAEVKRIKNNFGVTLNDVVLELCASILRRWLVQHEALPADPLLVMCPVSIRSGQESDPYSNRVSGMIATLATNIEDPGERLRAINRSTVAAKAQLQAVPADALQDFAQFSPPALAAMATRMFVRAEGATDQLNPPFNVLVSNVPGPRHPLYLAGAMQKHYYPVSTITDGMGLNITCTSYMDNLDFGLISCRELVPDLWQMTDNLHDALAELGG